MRFLLIGGIEMNELEIMKFARKGMIKHTRDIAEKMPDLEFRYFMEVAEELVDTLRKIDWITEKISELEESFSCKTKA